MRALVSCMRFKASLLIASHLAEKRAVMPMLLSTSALRTPWSMNCPPRRVAS